MDQMHLYNLLATLHHKTTPSLLPSSSPNKSLPQLPQRNLLVVVLIQHLGRREVEILLRHVYPPLPQGVHARFGADAFQLGAGAAVHLFGDLEQVDAAGEVHAAGVDAEDVGAGFDAGGWGISVWYHGFVEMRGKRT